MFVCIFVFGSYKSVSGYTVKKIRLKAIIEMPDYFLKDIIQASVNIRLVYIHMLSIYPLLKEEGLPWIKTIDRLIKGMWC